MGGMYKVGEAPWEQNSANKQVSVPQTPASPPSGAAFKVGQAPWETNQPTSPHEAAPAGPEKTSVGEAALQGFGQGGTLGYLPEMQAGVETGINAGMGKVNEYFPDTFQSYDPNLTYAKTLQEWRKQNETMKNEHPLATMGGNVAGALMTLPMGGPVAEGSAAVKGLQALGLGEKALTAAKIGKAATVGAGYGALANTENPEGDYLDLKQRLDNAKTGAIFGGGGEAAALGGAAALKTAAEKLKNSAIVKQIGANAGQIKTILKKDQLPEIGQFMKDEGLMGVGKNTEKVAEATKDILETDGPKIGQLYQDAQNQAQAVQNTLGVNNSGTKISGPDLADQIMAEVKAKAKNNPNRDQVMREMESSLQPLRDMGDNANILDVHDFRKGLDENIDWSKSSREKGIMQRSYVSARNIVADKTKDVINQLDNVLGGNKLGELKDLNQRFSNAALVNNTATQATGREMAKVLMGGALNSVGGGIAAQGEYSRSHSPLNAAGAFVLGSLATGAARKLAVPVSFQTGRAAGALSKGLEAVGNNPGMVGGGAAAAESPWLSINKKEKNK